MADFARFGTTYEVLQSCIVNCLQAAAGLCLSKPHRISEALLHAEYWSPHIHLDATTGSAPRDIVPRAAEGLPDVDVFLFNFHLWQQLTNAPELCEGHWSFLPQMEVQQELIHSVLALSCFQRDVSWITACHWVQAKAL